MTRSNRDIYFPPDEMERIDRTRMALGYEQDGHWHTPSRAELIRFLVRTGIDQLEGFAQAAREGQL